MIRYFMLQVVFRHFRCRTGLLLLISLVVSTLLFIDLAKAQAQPANPELDSLTRLIREETDESERLRLTLRRAIIRPIDRYEEALAEMESVLSKFEQHDDNEGRVRSYIALGHLHHKNRKYRDALSYDSLALKYATEGGYTRGEAWAYANLGREYAATNRISESNELYEKSLELELSFGDSESETLTTLYNQLGISNRILGNYSQSVDYLEKGIALAEKGNNRRLLGLMYMNVANTLVETSNYDNAIAYHMKAIGIWDLLGDRSGMAQSYNNLAILFRRNTEYEKSLAYLRKARAIHLETGDKRGLGLVASNVAINYISMGKLDSVAQFFEEAIDHFSGISDTRGEGLAQHNYGKFLLDQGGLVEAERRMLNAMHLRERSGSIVEKASTYANLGRLKIEAGNWREAANYLDEAERLLDTTQNSDYVLDLYIYKQLLYERQGNYKRAYEFQKRVADIRQHFFSEDARVNSLKAESKYELDKRDLQMEREREEQQAGRLKTMLISAVFILIMLVISVVLFFRSKQSKERYQTQLTSMAQQHQIETAKALRDSEEEERKKIAAKLHDEVGALLSIAKLNVSQLSEDVFAADSDAKTKLITAQKLLGDISETVRAISHTLMPVTMEKYGIKAAILDLVNAVNAAGKIKIEEVIQGLDDTNSWSEEFRVGLYRIVQEVLNNIIKHSNASHALVQVVELDDAVTIYMEDNGKGLTEFGERGGVGLRLLRSNIEYLNGALEINGQANRGTFVLIELPFGHARSV